MTKHLFLAVAALSLALPTSAQEAEAEGALSPNQIVDAAPADNWVTIAAEDLLVMTLSPDARGKPREVVIQLMPAPFSQGWVSNIRTLARAGWYDGISVNRVQDNYVVQWGDASEEKALPGGLRVMDKSHYIVDADTLGEVAANLPTAVDEAESAAMEADMAAAAAALEQVMSNPKTNEVDHGAAVGDFLAAVGLAPTGKPTPNEQIAMISITTTQTPTAPEGWHQRDSYAEWVEFWRGWPIANVQVGPWLDENENEVAAPNVPKHEAYALGYYRDVQESWFWPVHCYGMVGVGRDYSPDTGSGAELYTVIGHAPRHLDRNIALVGRVIEGIEHLSSLPRGTGELGFYESAEERVPIRSIRVASELPEGDQPVSSSGAVGQTYAFEYLSTESETFARYADARANRRDPFFIVPAGGADICNIPVPVRRVAAGK